MSKRQEAKRTLRGFRKGECAQESKAKRRETKAARGNVGQARARWVAWVLPAQRSVQQPAVLRAGHVSWGSASQLPPAPPHGAVSAQSWLSHRTRSTAAPSSCSLLKGHFAPVFLSVGLAPQAVGELTFPLISEQGDSSGNTCVNSEHVFVSCQGGCR